MLCGSVLSSERSAALLFLSASSLGFLGLAGMNMDAIIRTATKLIIA